jgi:hypothetical protein
LYKRGKEPRSLTLHWIEPDGNRMTTGIDLPRIDRRAASVRVVTMWLTRHVATAENRLFYRPAGLRHGSEACVNAEYAGYSRYRIEWRIRAIFLTVRASFCAF